MEYKVQTIKNGVITQHELNFDPTALGFSYNECGCKFLSFFRMKDDEPEKYEMQVWKDGSNFKLNRHIVNPDKPKLLVFDGLVHSGPVPKSHEELVNLLKEKTKLYL